MEPMSYRELKEALVKELQSINWDALNVEDLLSIKANLRSSNNIDFDKHECSGDLAS